MKFQEEKVSDNGMQVRLENNTSLPTRMTSSDILNHDGKLIIVHNGEEYILRITRSGKLILTK